MIRQLFRTSGCMCKTGWTRRTLRVEDLEPRRLLANVPSGFTETVLAGSLTARPRSTSRRADASWLAFQDGRIGVLEDGSAGVQQAFELEADGSGERGLQGIELDPNFEQNGYLYAYYTARSPEPHNRLSRLTVDPTTENTILPGSEVVLFDLPNLSDYGNPPWHIGGAIHSASTARSSFRLASHSRPRSLRIWSRPLGRSSASTRTEASRPTTRTTNPADGFTWRDYVWASGLRNPFAGDVDPVTGPLPGRRRRRGELGRDQRRDPAGSQLRLAVDRGSVRLGSAPEPHPTAARLLPFAGVRDHRRRLQQQQRRHAVS